MAALLKKPRLFRGIARLSGEGAGDFRDVFFGVAIASPIVKVPSARGLGFHWMTFDVVVICEVLDHRGVVDDRVVSAVCNFPSLAAEQGSCATIQLGFLFQSIRW